MKLSPDQLTYLTMLDAYATVLKDNPGKALRLSKDEAVFIENGQVYSASVDATGAVEMQTAGCITHLSWDDERGCWEYDLDAAACASAVNTPVFIDLSA